MKTMKKILAFSYKGKYDSKQSFVEVWYDTNKNEYILTSKYSTMKEVDKKNYGTKELAMYDAQRKIMFLLS